MEKKEKTHWLATPNKNYLGHWDLPESKELVLTIKSAQYEMVTNPRLKDGHPQKETEKRIIRWEEDQKPFICNEANAQLALESTGVEWLEDSVGKKLCLYQTKTKFAGKDVDCIRFRAQPIKNKPELTADHPRFEAAKKAWKAGKARGCSETVHCWPLCNS